MIIRGFGGNELAKELNVVKVRVMDTFRHTSTDLEAYVVPVICEPILDQNVEIARETYDDLKDLELADSTDTLDAGTCPVCTIIYI